MATQFSVTQSGQDSFRFELQDSAGAPLLFSGEYPDRESVEACIKAVQVGSLMGHQIAASKVPSGETFFVIKDTDGQIIAKSALYANQMEFDNALHHVKDNACIAEVVFEGESVE